MSNFKKAERKKAKLRLGISGTAGSGKTFSALQIAFGIGGKIAVIDTENHSAELYSHLGAYDVAVIEPPFSPQKYVNLIKEAEKNYDIIIVDSLTHAWDGEGGILDIKDQKMISSRKDSYTVWREVTPIHNMLVNTILQCKSHIIATIRSKQEYALIDNEEKPGKKKVEKLGMKPIQREGMEYEFSLFFDLQQNHYAVVSKDRTSLFDGMTFIPSIETGKQLLTWLESGIDAVEIHNQNQQIENLKKKFVKKFAELGYGIDTKHLISFAQVCLNREIGKDNPILIHEYDTIFQEIEKELKNREEMIKNNVQHTTDEFIESDVPNLEEK